MPVSLRSAAKHYRTQRLITARGVLAAQQAFKQRNSTRLLTVMVAHQRAAAREAIAAVPAMLAEQRIDAPAVAVVNDAAFARTASDGRSLVGLLQQAADEQALAVIVATQIQDAARVAAGVSTTVRPTVDGHVRYLNPPSCARCAILAGRFYRWSDGFQRHPRCDCVMVATTETAAQHLVSDPMQAFRDGQVRGMSAADTKAVADGADLGRVVNVRRSETGLSRAGRVLDRGGVPTPEGIYQFASDRADALQMLRRFGYIT